MVYVVQHGMFSLKSWGLRCLGLSLDISGSNSLAGVAYSKSGVYIAWQMVLFNMWVNVIEQGMYFEVTDCTLPMGVF